MGSIKHAKIVETPDDPEHEVSSDEWNDEHDFDLEAADVGSDPAGSAAAAIASHEGAGNPHPDYLTQAEGDARYPLLAHSHSLTSDEAFVTADTTLGNAAYADITGASLSLGAGTWLILATICAKGNTTNQQIRVTAAIANGSNNIVAESSGLSLAPGSSVLGWVNIALSAIVSPGSTTTYKLRGRYEGNVAVAANGAGTGTNMADSDSNKGTSIRAIRIA
jgi:hypothetical protein